MATSPADGKNLEAEEVWLVAKKGDVGHWAGVELLHTPPKCMFQGCQSRSIHERSPWEMESNDRGRWQVVNSNGQMVVCGDVERDNPQPCERALPPPVPAGRPTAAGGTLTIECWSLPVAESDVARIERVMAVFVEQLLAAGVTIPENFERVGRCGARNDPQPCYIYRFGNRRLHINIREEKGGRLCLVVRCGGGFLDFVEFARKNGSAEQMKLLKMHRRGVQGREVLQIASVYSNGERRIREMSSVNVSRPVSSRRM